MVTDSKWLIRVEVLASLPGDSVTLRRILESIRLLPSVR